MEQNKFDKLVKETLEQRLLTPSETAWEKLDVRLGGKATKKRYHIIYTIAASMVLFITVSQLTNRSSPVDTSIKTVKVFNQDVIEVKKESKQILDIKKSPLPEVAKIIPVKQNRIETPIKNLQETVVVQQLIEVEKNNGQSLKVINETLSIEVDNLLLMASQKIKDQAIIEKQLSLEAEALLADVEGEMEASFKSSVFEKIIKGFEKTKTTVVNRNN